MAKALSKAEFEQIDRCVLAVVEGSFFDKNFETLLGCSRNEAGMLYNARRLGLNADYDSLVRRVLGALINYPHRKPEELLARTRLDMQEVRDLRDRFRRASETKATS